MFIYEMYDNITLKGDIKGEFIKLSLLSGDTFGSYYKILNTIINLVNRMEMSTDGFFKRYIIRTCIIDVIIKDIKCEESNFNINIKDTALGSSVEDIYNRLLVINMTDFTIDNIKDEIRKIIIENK